MTECDHCGREQRGYAHLYRDGVNYALCHPDEGVDCYRLVTVYGEKMGLRKLAISMWGDQADNYTWPDLLPFEELDK